MADEKKEKIKTLVNQGPSKMVVFGEEVGPGKSFKLPLSKAVSVLAHYKHVVDADLIVAGTSDAAEEVAKLQEEVKELKGKIVKLEQDNAELTALLGADEPKPAAGAQKPK